MARRTNHRKGRFYRPELETGWERVASSWAFRVVAGVGLLAVVGVLVALAVVRFA
jgi:hypothetical protein